MNQTYIVIFESSEKSAEVKAHLKTYGTYCPITTNSWAITSSRSAAEIRDQIKPMLNVHDKVFVIRSGVEAAWTNQPQANTDWLKKYL